MGKHSASTNSIFWRTLALSLVKWLVIAALAISALIGGWTWLSNRNGADPAPDDDPAVTGPGVGGDGTREPSPDASPLASQLLDGAGKPEFLQSANQKLVDAGYEIVTTANASRRYEKTTVFYQDGHRDEATELGRLVGATEVETAPGNLDRNIPLTVVVGADYQP